MVLYDRLAEIGSEYLNWHKQVFVKICLKTGKWTDKDDAEECTTEIVAEQM